MVNVLILYLGIVESKSRPLSMSCDPHDRASRNDPLKSDSDLIQSAVMDCFPHLNDWIAADQISVIVSSFLD